MIRKYVMSKWLVFLPLAVTMAAIIEMKHSLVELFKLLYPLVLVHVLL